VPLVGTGAAAGTLADAGEEVHQAHPLGVKAFAYRRELTGSKCR
jgi:hypothetical protein